MDRATGESRAAVAALHRAERLRDAMIADDAAVTDYVAEHPETDVQKLRQLVRAARKEREAAKPPKSARELYKLLYATFLPPLTLDTMLAENTEADTQ
ncbi:MAG: ribosome biogenesis factor YjgA [Duodenibacillus sp.]